MRSWTYQQWLLGVLVGTAVVAVLVLFLLGLSAAISAGGAVELSSGTIAWLSNLCAVAIFAGVLAAALATAWIATKGVEKRLEKKNSSYVQFVGVSVSVLTWAMGKVFTDDALVAGVLAAFAGLLSVGASKAIKRWPLIGLALYACLPTGTIVVAHMTGMIDVIAWLSERSPRDVALLTVLVAIVVAPPTTVYLVERHWETERWMFGDRFDGWLRRHSALAWLTRGEGGAKAIGE